MTSPSVCPDVGVWRAWLDHEAGLAADGLDLEAHLHTCPGCRQAVAELEQDAAFARATVGALPPLLASAGQAALARERLAWRQRTAAASRTATAAGRPGGAPTRTPQERITMTIARISTPWRVAASGLAAALVVSVVVAFSPGARTAAAAFLAQFRSQEVAAIEVTPQTQADITRTLSMLNNLGTVQGTTPSAIRGSEQRGEQRSVSLDEASREVGFALKTPDPAALPAGLSATPRVNVTPAFQERFTFSKAKAAAYFQSAGHPEVSLPDKFDGASLVVSIPAAAMLQYGNDASREALVIGQAGEIVVDVQGNVSLDELRDFLLGLPGLPPAAVAQLRQIRNWNDTLPIPVPVDKVHWQPASFPNGGQGLLLNDNSGVGSAAIWHQSGHLYGVAGSLKATDLKRVADSLAAH